MRLRMRQSSGYHQSMVLIPNDRDRVERRAFLTGITGQDGSYLAELLLAKGYEVHGLVRRSSSSATDRLDALQGVLRDAPSGLHLHHGELTDGSVLRSLITEIEPHEVYNLGAQSHVQVSFENPVYTADVDALGTLRLLEAVRALDFPVRFYQASSSEMFGAAADSPQNESTAFHPRSPYACAKVYAYHQTINYREAYGLFACNGILFNHESPRRSRGFVTRKITRAAARISLGMQKHLYLGNVDACRDWGFAGDYVDAMWRMMQVDTPSDYVVATGVIHSVHDFVVEAFDQLDLDVDAHLRVDPTYRRPSEVDVLKGDASKARRELGWSPVIGFEELVRMMVSADLEQARVELAAGVGRDLESDRAR